MSLDEHAEKTGEEINSYKEGELLNLPRKALKEKVALVIDPSLLKHAWLSAWQMTTFVCIADILAFHTLAATEFDYLSTLKIYYVSNNMQTQTIKREITKPKAVFFQYCSDIKPDDLECEINEETSAIFPSGYSTRGSLTSIYHSDIFRTI